MHRRISKINYGEPKKYDIPLETKQIINSKKALRVSSKLCKMTDGKSKKHNEFLSCSYL